MENKKKIPLYCPFNKKINGIALERTIYCENKNIVFTDIKLMVEYIERTFKFLF